LAPASGGAEEPWAVSPDHPVLEGTWPPASSGPRPAEAVGSSNPVSLVFAALIRIYQEGISPVDGATCGFYPTCSGYGLQAVRRHGWLVGGAMAMERSMRYHAADDLYPWIRVHGVWRLFDPLDANDFWFASAEEKKP